MRPPCPPVFILLLVIALLPLRAQAQALPADASGGADHPSVSRYAGSWLVATENRSFDAVEIPAGPKEADLARVEGRISRLFYLAPAGRSVLEVQRNYERALEKAGASRRDACAMPACGARPFDFVGIAQGKQLATGTVDRWGAQSLVDQWIDAASVRGWYGTLQPGACRPTAGSRCTASSLTPAAPKSSPRAPPS